MSNIPQDDTPRKQCKGPCNQLLPATNTYFSRTGKEKYPLDSICNECRRLRWQAKHPSARPRGRRNIQDDVPEGYKRCTKCKVPHPATTEYFEPTKHNRTGLRPGCRQCRAKEWKVYNDAHAEDHNHYYQEHIQLLHLLIELLQRLANNIYSLE